MPEIVAVSVCLVAFPKLGVLSSCFSILTQNGVIYMAFCDKNYPTKLAYTYLEEIAKEFEMQYGREVERVERPYAFIKFGIDNMFTVYEASSASVNQPQHS